MAELVYAFDLKSNGEIHAGSIPALGTKIQFKSRRDGIFLVANLGVQTNNY